MAACPLSPPHTHMRVLQRGGNGAAAWSDWELVSTQASAGCNGQTGCLHLGCPACDF